MEPNKDRREEVARVLNDFLAETNYSRALSALTHRPGLGHAATCLPWSACSIRTRTNRFD